MFPSLPNNYAQLRSFTINSATIPVEHFRDLFDPSRAGLWLALETLELQVDKRTPTLRDWREIDQVVPLSSLSMLAASCPRLHTLDLYLYYPLGKGDRETELLTPRFPKRPKCQHFWQVRRPQEGMVLWNRSYDEKLQGCQRENKSRKRIQYTTIDDLSDQGWIFEFLTTHLLAELVIF